MDASGPARLAGRLRGAGLRATRPRVLVLGVLEELGGHRSVEQLAATLRGRGSPLPRASVYNVVNDLAVAGLVMTAGTGPGPALYEAGARWHHHFLCNGCGAVLDVPCRSERRPCLEPELAGAEVEEALVTFRGRCPACAD